MTTDKDQAFQLITLPAEHWSRVLTVLNGTVLDAPAHEVRAFLRPLTTAQVQTVTEGGAETLIVTLPKGLWAVVRATLNALKWQITPGELVAFLDDLDAAPVKTVVEE